jgi:hypothetical protein
MQLGWKACGTRAIAQTGWFGGCSLDDCTSFRRAGLKIADWIIDVCELIQREKPSLTGGKQCCESQSK